MKSFEHIFVKANYPQHLQEYIQLFEADQAYANYQQANQPNDLYARSQNLAQQGAQNFTQGQGIGGVMQGAGQMMLGNAGKKLGFLSRLGKGLAGLTPIGALMNQKKAKQEKEAAFKAGYEQGQTDAAQGQNNADQAAAQAGGEQAAQGEKTDADYQQAARDVWAGRYGNGQERVQALQAAGFDPQRVQQLVQQSQGGGGNSGGGNSGGGQQQQAAPAQPEQTQEPEPVQESFMRIYRASRR